MIFLKSANCVIFVRYVYREVRAVHHVELCSPPEIIRKVLAVRVISTPTPSSSSYRIVLNLHGICHCDCPLGHHGG